MLELDILEASYQLLNGSSVGHRTGFFEREVTIDLLDNEFRISLYLKSPDFLF